MGSDWKPSRVFWKYGAEAERRAKEDREVERKSQEEFDQAQEQTPP
jgi:hypothetical protein